MDSIAKYTLHVSVPNTATVEHIVGPFVDDAGGAGYQRLFAIKYCWEHLVVNVHPCHREPSCLSRVCDHRGYRLSRIDELPDRKWTYVRVLPSGDGRVYPVGDLFDMLPDKRAVNGENHTRRILRSSKVNRSNARMRISASHDGKVEGTGERDVSHKPSLTGGDLVAAD
jgi:hypothetical protein